METKSWQENKASGQKTGTDAQLMQDEIEDLRDECVGLEAELRAWRKKFPDLVYVANGGFFRASTRPAVSGHLPLVP